MSLGGARNAAPPCSQDLYRLLCVEGTNDLSAEELCKGVAELKGSARTPKTPKTRLRQRGRGWGWEGVGKWDEVIGAQDFNLVHVKAVHLDV